VGEAEGESVTCGHLAELPDETDLEKDCPTNRSTGSLMLPVNFVFDGQATRHDMSGVQMIKGYLPGVIGRVTELHAAYYQREWGFGLFFEAKVATELASFLQTYNEQRDAIWVARLDENIEGSVAIDGAHAATHGAHLRWFMISDALRGRGVGQQLIEAAIAFCRTRHYPRIYLWTFEGLDAARHVYEKNGFRLVEEQKGARWGREVNEQQFVLDLS
jgi:GNAT superfamily N-acetyltransferase